MKLSQDFINFIQQNRKLITMKASTRYPELYVLKYTRTCFYDGIWNDYLVKARGMVVDKDHNIVAYGFDKIFNRFENGTDINRDETVVAVQKVNGFMAAATYVPSLDEVVVSTTGSLDSDFVGYAEKYIDDSVKSVIRDLYKESGTVTTFVFEICHPEDPHIIPENLGAYLIGCRNIEQQSAYHSSPILESTLDNIAEEMKVFRPVWKVCRFADVVIETESCKHEGFVVYGQSSKASLKIKSPYYLTLKACARKKDILSLDKRRVDEEYYDLIAHLKELGNEFNAMEEQSRLEYIVEYLER